MKLFLTYYFVRGIGTLYVFTYEIIGANTKCLKLENYEKNLVHIGAWRYTTCKNN